MRGIISPFKTKVLLVLCIEVMVPLLELLYLLKNGRRHQYAEGLSFIGYTVKFLITM